MSQAPVYESTPSRGDAPPGRLLKYTSYVVRNPSLSEAEFHEHWRHHHARFPLSAFLSAGVVRYTQYHISSATRSLLDPIVAARKANPKANLKFELAPWDGVIQIWFKDMESWRRVTQDPIFGKAIFEDELYMFDLGRGETTLGWEEEIVEGGEVVGPGLTKGIEGCECLCAKCRRECEDGKGE